MAKELKLRTVLLTPDSLKLKTWNGTKWFAVEWAHVPYWEANENNAAFGEYDNGISLGVKGEFSFLVVFLAGEFVCSIEVVDIVPENCSLKIDNIELLKDQGLVKCELL